MMIFTFLEKILQLGIPVETYFWMYDIVFTAVLIFGLVLYLFTWDVTKIWLRAWWEKKPVILEQNKKRQFIFRIPQLQKGIDNAVILEDGNRVVELRQESVGFAPHKVPMALASSEYPCTFNVNEATGERFYAPEDTFYGVMVDNEIISPEEPTEEEKKIYNDYMKNLENKEFMKNYPNYRLENKDEINYLHTKINLYNSRRLYVRYPDHTVNINEFVKYQSITANPLLTALFGESRAIAVKKQMTNPLSMINMQVLIPLIMVIAIAWMMMSQHNIGLEGYDQALQCTTDYQELAKECGKNIVNWTYANAPNTGGTVK